MLINCQDFKDESFVADVAKGLHIACAQQTGNDLSKQAILVAFSGGPDSTALLIALAILKKKIGFSLKACHVNHNLRGAEALADETFCRKLCSALEIPLSVQNLDALTITSEAYLRALRYEALSCAAQELDCGVCVTGHTANDQVETMLFRLFRGTGPSGLAGIRVFRQINNKLTVLRPMLAIQRSHCLAFLEKVQIKPCCDSSNLEFKYARNYIRHEIMPVIENRFPGFVSRLAQLQQMLIADDNLLADLARQAVKTVVSSQNTWDCQKFLVLPYSLQGRVLAQEFYRKGIEPTFTRINKILAMLENKENKTLSLNENWDIKITTSFLYWLPKALTGVQTINQETFEQVLAVPGLTLIPGCEFAIRVVELKQEEAGDFPKAQEWEILADLSAVSGSLYARLRKPGDYMYPFGMNKPVRLKKYLHTHKSKQTLSFSGRILLLSDNKEVLWVPGCGISDKIAVRRKPTHRIVLLKIALDQVGIC